MISSKKNWNFAFLQSVLLNVQVINWLADHVLTALSFAGLPAGIMAG